jgi:CheY-like chemotaxis protein
LNLRTHFDPAAGTISGDPARLQQVVWNLISNAIKFTPHGGDVSIRVERTATHLEIAVADSGQGIDSEFLPYVFERFRQSDKKSTQREGGLGLGLAIVRHLVELHGGTISAASEGEGKGATFTVRLPLSFKADDININAIAAVDKADGAPPAVSLHGVRVLVVDDDEDNREMVQIILQRFGATVFVAPSAGAALKLIDVEKPDVLVSDIGMPDVDGYSLIRTVRALGDRQLSRLPAVALTAYARHEDREKALEAGFQEYLSKPVDPAELAKVIGALARASK